MTKTWQYTVSGKAAGGDTWATSGTVHCEFSESFKASMRAAFEAVTDGRAEYGKPGQGGCKGPYSIKSVLIEELEQ